MAKFEVSSSDGVKIVEADKVIEREGYLHFSRADDGFVAAFASGYWVCFMLVSEGDEIDPETVLSLKAA